MLSRLRPRMTYANVVSTIALVLAIGGGTAYAATKIGTRDIRYHAVTGSKLATNAVSASKIKSNAVSASDVRDNTLTSAEIRTGTLLASDFAANQLPKGDKGDPATSIFGVVGSGGGRTNFKHVTAVSGNGLAGVGYTVTIDQDVSKCAAVATLQNDTNGPGAVTGAPVPGNVQQIKFRTFDAVGEIPLAFQFAVYC